MSRESAYEAERLAFLQGLDLLDTAPSESFDRIVRIAGRLFRTPMAAMSLTDRHRQWFKAQIGCAGTEIPRDKAPCALVTETGDSLVVSDLGEDARFSTGILAQTGVRFYAGAPLRMREGHCLGALCVLDTESRSVTDEEVATLRDLAAMVTAQVELERAARRIEPASGLPNRHQFLEDAAAKAGPDGPGAVRLAVLIDLADAQHLADATRALGSAYLDGLLAMARREAMLFFGPAVTVYQVGATQFAALLDRDDGPGTADLLRRIRTRIEQDVDVDGVPVPAHVAIGAVRFRPGTDLPGDVLRRSYAAARDAREASSRTAVYAPAIDEAHRRRFLILGSLPAALDRPDELHLVYQPRIDLRTGRCVGAEALIRWTHPTLGEIPPGEFVPFAEQTTLSRPLTEWVIDTAMARIAAWQAEGRMLRVSVNVSAPNFEEPDFARRVGSALGRHGVAPDNFEIEFTESALIRNRDLVLGQLAAIRALGVRCAIDDFGSGYSSFAYLKDLPADVVKLDRMFLKDLATSERDRTLVRSMAALARDLGLNVVAEGVETQEMLELLSDWGCDEAQGYLIARPMAPDALVAWLTSRDAERGGTWPAMTAMPRLAG